MQKRKNFAFACLEEAERPLLRHAPRIPSSDLKSQIEVVNTTFLTKNALNRKPDAEVAEE